MRKTEPIDNALNAKLSNIELDGKGIAWNDFVYKRKKKRAFFYFKTIGFLVLGLGALTLGFSQLCHSNSSQLKAANVHEKFGTISSTTHTEKKYNKLINNDLLTSTTKHTETADASTLRSTYRRNLLTIETPTTSVDNTDVISEINPSAVQNHLQLVAAQFIPTQIEVTEKQSLIDPVEGIKKPEEKTQIKTYIELGFTGLSASQNLKISQLGNSFVHRDYSSIRNAAETGKYGLGLNFSYGKIIKDLEVSIGLNYYKLNSNSHYNFIYKDRPIIDIDGKIVGYNSGNEKQINFSSKQSSSFIEIPLQLDYYFKNKNPFSLNKKGLHLGLYPQFLQSNLGQLPNAQFLDLKDNLNTENYKTGMMGLEFGISIKHRINQNTAIKLMPYYRLNSGLRQVQSHYTTQMNYLGLKCLLQLGL